MERSFPRLARLDLGEAVPNHLAGATGSVGRGARVPRAWQLRFPQTWCSGAQVSGGVSRPQPPARRSAPGASVRVPGARPSPRPPQRRRLPLPRRARPVPVPGGGPSRRSAALPSPPEPPAALPPLAGLQGPPSRGSEQERAAIAHGGGRRRPGAGRPRWREARGDSAPSALARSLAGSPPPALRWLPPLPGVIDPSRAPPPPPPPRPF